jgi:ADP-L-glycero-D-manno-heptose 6-epimerase
MSSLVYKGFRQISAHGSLRLFKSYRPDYPDGGQQRDFVYVKDCADIIGWLVENPSVNGLYNLGTGRERSWNDLAAALFQAMNLPVKIEYIEMPERIQSAYQYYTCADVQKLKAAGCPVQFAELEDAIADYVHDYLQRDDPYL